MVVQVADDIEDDWEILRRAPNAEAFPSTLDMAEAIERICKAVVDFAILLADNPSRTKEMIEVENKFPVFSIIPYYDVATKKRLWRVRIDYEMTELKYMSKEHECCESAVEQLFNNVSTSIIKRAKEFATEAEASEQEAADAKDTARKLQRLSSTMGTYSPKQPNLDLKVSPS